MRESSLSKDSFYFCLNCSSPAIGLGAMAVWFLLTQIHYEEEKLEPIQKSKKTYFPHPATNVSDDQAKQHLVLDMLLWIADEHEKTGRMDLAKKYREWVKNKQK